MGTAEQSASHATGEVPQAVPAWQGTAETGLREALPKDFAKGRHAGILAALRQVYNVAGRTFTAEDFADEVYGWYLMLAAVEVKFDLFANIGFLQRREAWIQRIGEVVAPTGEAQAAKDAILAGKERVETDMLVTALRERHPRSAS